MESKLKECLSHYSGKTVLVTGHTGFKGSWISLWLQLLGAHVIGYAQNPKDQHDIFNMARVSENLTDHRGDIRDLDKLQAVFARHAPEFVFHLAAQPIVRESYRAPKETLDVNIGGTVNVLEACRATASVRSIVVVTSDKCYLNKGKQSPYREGDRLGGHDPYSASKACTEIVTNAYYHSFFMEKVWGGRSIGLATARAGNVIGGGDWAGDRLVPDCMRAMRAGQPIRIRNPRHTRPWQFVLEPIAGYLLLGASLHVSPGRFSGAWNFGPERKSEVQVMALVKEVIKAYGQGFFIVDGLKDQLAESCTLALNVSKSERKLQWRPALTLDQAVQLTVDWYKRSEMVRDLRDFSLMQINAYMKRMEKAHGNH